MAMNYDVEIKILGKKNPIIVTEPFTPEAAPCSGRKNHPLIGAFMFGPRMATPGRCYRRRPTSTGSRSVGRSRGTGAPRAR